VAALEIKKATGTVRVDGQTCTLASYRASINYWLPGMRAQYSCTTPDGRMRKAIEVVSGNSRDEDIAGAELIAARARDPEAQCAHRAADPDLERAAGSGQGAAEPVPILRSRWRRQDVATYAIPGGGRGRAGDGDPTAPTMTCLFELLRERVEVRQGSVVTEFLLLQLLRSQRNRSTDRCLYRPCHREARRRDHSRPHDCGNRDRNPYVVMPVPAGIRR